MRQEEECYWCHERAIHWETVGTVGVQLYLCPDCYQAHQRARLERYRAVQAEQEARQEQERLDHLAHAAVRAYRGIPTNLVPEPLPWHTIVDKDLWRGVARAVLDAAQKEEA